MSSSRLQALATRPLCKLLNARCSSTVTAPDFSGTFKKSLLNINPTEVTVLPNGIRVCSEYTDTPTATLGLWINAGTRWETAENNGVAHFLEHMIFKGTANRSQHELELEVENMGAHLNAYTSREQTVYYGKCLAKDVDRSMDILADILQNPKLEEGAIERERHVILREMQEVEMNLQEVMFDHLHASAYMGTPLAFNILGPTANINSISREALQQYITTHYQPHNIVVAAAGGVDHWELVKLAEKHFGGMQSAPDQHKVIDFVPARYSGSMMHLRDDSIEYAHIVLAVEGCGWTDPDYFALMLANMIVGSWSRSQGGGIELSSPFAKKMYDMGKCQSYMSFNTCYKDTGLWGVYGVVKPDDDGLRKYVGAVQAEWRRVHRSITPGEVQRAKNLLKTTLLAGCDGTTAVCEDIGRQMLTYGRRMTFAEVDSRIEAVTPELLKKVMFDYVADYDPVLVSFGSVEGLNDYLLVKTQQSSGFD